MGSIPLIDLLLKSGAKINEICSSGNSLHIALLSEKLDVFAYLIDQEGIDLTTSDIDGNTILHVAARSGLNKEVEKILFKTKGSGQILNAKNNIGNTALHESAIVNATSIEQLLRSQPDIDPEIKNSKGQTARDIKDMQCAAAKRKQEEANISQIKKRSVDRVVVLGEKEKSKGKDYYIKRPNFFCRPWGIAIIAFAIILACLYVFFAFSIKSKLNWNFY